MAKHRMDVTTFVGKLLEESDVDLLREGVRMLAQLLMDAEVSNQIGAGLYERSGDRVAHRNGYRIRTWDTRVGTVELRVPKVAPGTYFVGFFADGYTFQYWNGKTDPSAADPLTGAVDRPNTDAALIHIP